MRSLPARRAALLGTVAALGLAAAPAAASAATPSLFGTTTVKGFTFTISGFKSSGKASSGAYLSRTRRGVS